ncbi:cytokinesis regulator [Ophiocordyceps camponoti-floridani]|uniref:Cytokinesis regulator n=1 Tax=Ophiocordyceps camponoti-floridani TaxID=2030778 RepID=A0A8H4Q1P6_9HYPO|nr:cytokinesis regulator [Ophiocordyceps camponoti-floridani]
MDDIENWDDDDLLVDGDELSFRSSLAAVANHGPPRRRDSASSHVSLRSDLESWPGDEKQLHLPADDEASTIDAIAAAQHAGIPLPKNIPSSALMGGTIKRLGGRKIGKLIQEDWESDLELPDASQALKLKPKTDSDFPDTLRQVSGESVQLSPRCTTARPPTAPEDSVRRNSSRTSTPLTPIYNIDESRYDDDFVGSETIKVSKHRPQQPVSFITPPTPQKQDKEVDEDFEKDLELPSGGKLMLSTKRDIPRTPFSQPDELDWGEGSLGTRYGGTRRDGRSNRSSSASALSPSVSSSITMESEDETLEGLILPPGPVNFRERLKKRRKSISPERIPEEPEPPSLKKPLPVEADRQDFFDGLDICDGKVFDSGNLTLHRNVQVKTPRPCSPARIKTAVSLTFTNKTPTTQTRIPRLSHERAHSTSLEPVYESPGSSVPQRSRRSRSRLGHTSQLSVTSLPTPTTTSSPGRSMPPSTPQRREIGTRSSFTSLRGDPPTTSAQLLKQKRSLPAVRQANAPAKSAFNRPDRPPSSSGAPRPQSGFGLKTPADRQRPGIVETILSQARRSHLPFLPAGASQSQSQHVSSKTMRPFRRHDSDNAIDTRPFSRTLSRSTARSPSPRRWRVAADTWERLSKPKNKKQFGDGHELDGFDDLPTSREMETRFLRQPVANPPKTSLRSKIYQHILPDRMCTPAPTAPCSPSKTTPTPRFARDTAASRIARETGLAQRAPSSGSAGSATVQKEAPPVVARSLQPPLPLGTMRTKKSSKRPPPQLKPHLIANLNTGKESKVVNGMFYNANTYRWEGNENALNVFDNAPASTPSTTSAAQPWARDKEVTTPRPALITNISATKGVQVVGGMVFDPQNMCWLKIGLPNREARSDTGDTMDGFNALEDDEDVFKDIPDLDDNGADDGEGRMSDIKDEWLVGEEFDVGPEFIRRQREEEDRWRKKCEKWIGRGLHDRETWRWTIRDLVSQFDDLPM